MADYPGELNKMASNENNDENTEEYWRLCALQLASSVVVPMVVQVVVDLKVLEIISKAGAEGVLAGVIASQLELTDEATTASSMLDRMLYLLSAHSILTCTLRTTNDDPHDGQMTTKRRLYALAPITKYFIPNSDGVSFGPFMSLHHDNIVMDIWRELKPAMLKGGNPWNKLYGMHVFDYVEMTVPKTRKR